MKYTVDFTNIRSYADIHRELKKNLSLPEYYGENLDALYDSLTDMVEDDTVIVIKSFDRVTALSNDYAEKMLAVFRAVKDFAESLHISFDVIIE